MRGKELADYLDTAYAKWGVHELSATEIWQKRQNRLSREFGSLPSFRAELDRLVEAGLLYTRERNVQVGGVYRGIVVLMYRVHPNAPVEPELMQVALNYVLSALAHLAYIDFPATHEALRTVMCGRLSVASLNEAVGIGIALGLIDYKHGVSKLNGHDAITIMLTDKGVQKSAEHRRRWAVTR